MFLRSSLPTLLFALLVVSHASAAPRVVLHLVTDEGFPITGHQQWLQMLGTLDFDGLRISKATGSEKIEVVREGSDAAPVYRVTGFLSRGNQLMLPNGRFTLRDKSAILDWKNRLVRGGAGGLEPKVQAAFGLSAEQLVAMHERLSRPASMNTKGKSPKDIVRSITRTLPGGLTIDPDVLRTFEDEWIAPEEMEGLSAGAVLAAAIRPLGLVLVPHAVGENDVRLIITDSRKAPQSWPIGWPPEEKERDLAPKLYEFFTFEAPGNPLPQALDAIQANLELPFLYDHNGMARQGIDPAKVMITFPEARSYYKKVLSRVLFQAKLKSELRVDEAGQPFVWISPLKQ